MIQITKRYWILCKQILLISLMMKSKKGDFLIWLICSDLLFPGMILPLHPTNTIRLFSKKVPVTASLGNYTEAVISRFHQDGTPHIICCSNDFQRGAFSISNYLPANSESKMTFNKKTERTREACVFWMWSLWMYCEWSWSAGTLQPVQFGPNVGFASKNIDESFLPITMWIAPAKTTDFDFTSFPNGHPSSDQLKDLDWLEVKIGCSPEQIVVLSGGSQAKRIKYALKHQGALIPSINHRAALFIMLLLKYLLSLPHGNQVKSLLPCLEKYVLEIPP